MILSHEERERGQFNVLYDKVIQVVIKFSERTNLTLVNRSGSKYSIV